MFCEWLKDEDAPPFRKRAMQRLVRENDQKRNLIVTSVATHIELIPDRLPSGMDRRYTSQFDGDRMVDCEITHNVVLRAREIRNHYFRPATDEGSAKIMDLGDSIHLATATILGVTQFHTRDNSRKKGKVPLVSLYEWSGDTKICGKYELDIISPEDSQTDLMDAFDVQK